MLWLVSQFDTKLYSDICCTISIYLSVHPLNFSNYPLDSLNESIRNKGITFIVG